MGVNVQVPRWETVKNWTVKGRPATQKRVGSKWVGLPGGENPKPNIDYRIAISWGVIYRIIDTASYMNHAEMRVVFDGWNIGNRLRYRDSIQFYTDSSFNNATRTSYRVQINFAPETKFLPTHADSTTYAYFRVKQERSRAWKMKYNIGIYGNVHAGVWKKITAR